MASDEERLVVSLEARIRDFERNFQKATRTADESWRTIEQRGEAGSKKVAAAMLQATEGVSGKLTKLASTAAGALTAAIGLHELREMADEWTAFGARIAASGVAAEDLGDKLRQLSDIAIRSHASIEDVGQTYVALRRASAELGASEAQTVRVTETLQKALTLGGQPAATTKAALLEISHALAGGRINGVELNKLLFEAPVLVQHIAKEFGVSAGKLRELKEEGTELSADKVFMGILHGTEAIEAAFAKMKPTIAQSFNMLRTSMVRYIGETDQAVGASRAISDAIIGMSHHMDIAAPAAFALAAGLSAAFLGGPVVGGITAATVAVVGLSDSIHPISGELASLADYAVVAWGMIKDKGGEAAEWMQEKFAEACDQISAAMSSIGGSGFESFLSAVKTLANAVIGTFVFAATSIKESFNSIGPEIKEGIIESVNQIVESVEWMVNKVIEGVNAITSYTNTITGSSFHLDKIDLGRVSNDYAGAGVAAGKAFKKAFDDAYGKDYVGDALKVGGAIRDEANKRAAERKAERDKAKKPKDEGSLDQELKTSEDPKKVKAYNDLITKSREYIQTQEIERKAMTMAAVEAAQLRHEQQLLNQASGQDIELTDKQREQLHALAGDMAKAEVATKQFTDMKQSIEELSSTISSELGNALEGLINRTTKVRDVFAKLAVMFFKMAMEAALLGKGPLAGVLGIKDGGLTGVGSLDQKLAKSLLPDTSSIALKQIMKTSPLGGKSDNDNAKGVADRVGGSRSWRNNNPGNIEYGPFAKSAGAIGSDGRFAVFPDYAAGRGAQEKLLFESKNYRDLNLGQAVGRWAPASENNVPAYLAAMGADPKTRMRDFTPPQRTALLDAMQKHEGWKEGRLASKDGADTSKLDDTITGSIAPLNEMQQGVEKMTGSLTQGVPEVGSFTSSIEQLVGKLFSGSGGMFASVGTAAGFAEGGHVRGPGTSTSDSIPAMLSAGEFVVSASATARHRGVLEAINNGKRLPAFAGGGFVGMNAFSQSSSYQPTVNVNVSGGGRDAGFAKQVADHVGDALAAQKPDGFRRGRDQQLAGAFRAMARAHGRNG
jgi:tape measure domain-containing protein